MTLSVDLFFSFRSPYSYLALPKTLEMVADYDVAVNLRPVYPLAVRVPGFFKKTNPSCFAAWIGAKHHRVGAMVAAGLLLGFGWMTRHEQVLAVAPVGAFLLAEHWGHPRRLLRDLALIAPGLLGAAAVLGIYNHIRFGSLLEFGYRPTFGLEGFWGFTLSPGGAIVLYSPVVVVALAGLWMICRRDRATALLIGGQFLVFFLFFASLDDWPGGRAYGPRYLVPRAVAGRRQPGASIPPSERLPTV